MRNRERKITRNASGLMAFWGFMLILGTAGASDLGNITTGQAMFQSLIGLALFAVGVVFARRE